MLNDSECSAGMEANLSLKQRSIPVTINLFLRHQCKIMVLTITVLHKKQKTQNGYFLNKVFIVIYVSMHHGTTRVYM